MLFKCQLTMEVLRATPIKPSMNNSINNPKIAGSNSLNVPGSGPGSGFLNVNSAGGGFHRSRKRSNVSFHSDIIVENRETHHEKNGKKKILKLQS